MKRFLFILGAIGLFAGAMQIIQPTFENPPVAAGASFEEAAKPPAEVAGVFNRACADCHSHKTRYPWYSKISPVSWLLDHDIRTGRAHLNFSTWNLNGPEASRLRMTEVCDVVKKGEMPDPKYLMMHPEAKLTASEKAAVCAFAAAL